MYILWNSKTDLHPAINGKLYGLYPQQGRLMSDSTTQRYDNFSLKKRLIYLFLVFIIGLVCVYDNILNVCFATSLARDEMNPICRLLIGAYGVREFILIKAFCTIIGISALIVLIYTKFRIAVVIMFFLSLVLFFYLTFYDHGGDYRIKTFMKEKSAFVHVLEFYFQRDNHEIMDSLVDQEEPLFLRKEKK